MSADSTAWHYMQIREPQRRGRPPASTSQMGRLETEWLATDANLDALADLAGAWIDRLRGPPVPAT